MYHQVIKRRNMLVQVILFLATFGIYGLYWFYETASEMKIIAQDPEASPGLWTVLLLLPLINLYALYRFGELFETVSTDRTPAWLMFVLGIVFPPAVWFVTQLDLNTKADVVLLSPST